MRLAPIVALALCACTADASVGSAEAPKPPGSQAAAAAQASDTASPAPAPIAAANVAPPTVGAATAPTPGTIADGSAPMVASTSAASADAPVECPATVAELPASSSFDADDRRLTRSAALVVRKSERRLMLYDDGKLELCFRVGLGFAPVGHKAVEGDGKTPEGWYRTSDKPWSSFENAIAIHYPNELDASAAVTDGRIGKKTRDKIVAELRAGRVPPQYTKLGGAVLIHGGGGTSDWTLGCVALDDADLVTLRASLGRGMRTNLLVLP